MQTVTPVAPARSGTADTAPSKRRWADAVLAGGAALASAATGVHAREAQPLWEAGVFVGAAAQPAYPGAEDHTRRAAVLPFFVYRGPLLRVDDDGAALRALRTPRFELNVGVAGALGSAADEVDARAGMPDLGLLIEAGPRLVWNLIEPRAAGRAPWRLEVPLRAVLEIDGGVRYRGLAFAPELVHERRLAAGWNAGLRFGPVFGNEGLADLFYQVDPVHATATRPAYDARGGLIAWRAGASLQRSLGRDLSIFGFVRLESVAGAANRNSPLVRRDSGVAGGVGLVWTLARSTRPATD